MAERDPLSADSVQEHLTRWPGWSGDTHRITRNYAIDYYTGIKIINALVEPAQRLQHHPDIDLRWERLTIGLTTYSAGGVVTELDFKLVAELERITQEYGAE